MNEKIRSLKKEWKIKNNERIGTKINYRQFP